MTGRSQHELNLQFLNSSEPAFLNELQKETTPSLSLNKALYLLVNVHANVLDKTINTFQHTSPLERSLELKDSPTLHALLSLEKYMQEHPDQPQHLFDPLMPKVLKQHTPSMRVLCFFLLFSAHHATACNHLRTRLVEGSKKDQLALILLLQCLCHRYPPSEQHNPWLSSLLSPCIALVLACPSPTLLACSAYNLIMEICSHLLSHSVQPQTVAPYLVQLIPSLQKWHASKDELSQLAYQELIGLLSSEKLTASMLHIITTHLKPKTVLSTVPLSVPRIQAIRTQYGALPTLARVKLLLVLVLQNGSFGIYRQKEFSKEAEEIKSHFLSELKLAETTANSILATLFTYLPFLVPPHLSPLFHTSFPCLLCLSLEQKKG